MNTPAGASEPHAVAIAGAGFSGLGLAMRLRAAGIEDFVVLERGTDVGGIWRDNAYPGCACDIPSVLYSFSFAPRANWTRSFPGRDEIWQYLRDCAAQSGVAPRVTFGFDLQRAVYDESAALWSLAARDGRTVRARVLVLATGALNRPNVPELPGLETFAGPVFHSSQWRPDVDLRGLHVAVVGTGASAIQIVPAIAPHVRSLTLYQRSAAWILPRRDAEVAPLARAARRWIPGLARLQRSALFWALEARGLGFVRHLGLLSVAEAASRAHLNAQVRDPALREALTPNYRLGCKRVLLSDDFYPALARDNVELVRGAVAAVDGDALVTEDGSRRPAGAIVLATGFRATGLPEIEIAGRGGRTLAQAWSAGMEAYLGSTVAGFPNFFTIVGPNTGLGHNSMVEIMEAQYRYVLGALEAMAAREVRAFDVRPESQARYNRWLRERLAATVWSSGCTSWYLDASGRNTTLWPGLASEFARRTRRFDAEAYEPIP